MKYPYLILSAFLFWAYTVNAQTTVKGTVVESGKNNKMSDVFVRDNQNRQMTLTDSKGNFSIRTETGHTLIFSSPGYVSDTLYVTDFTNKKIEMVAQTIALRQVNISAKRQTFDAHKEYPEVYTRAKVYPLSPTSWFSKEAKDARRLKKYFKHEEEERHVDEVFTMNYVQSIIPLRGQELENFMTIYRPSYEFVKNNNGPSMAVYINDSYKKYLALPADKRTLPDLKE
ncbi:carboxypeptidase-like regulatory domain-containing protein [Mucilaginibacter rubeus]|uniref:Carboxypeptidase-like regulatory domain-containing protein n=1 Tax=Mucilaginibacter rubeus TaxID=2027860 RepID=A0AAE6JNR1_9SPHI|nr:MULTISPECIES: carboxypeptidase-like regulatory domain-containing protein [Mucilaginibacter]QEM07967.1 carboxypeptidase-like regulatory domain-containing protein [Mucilaginibacter rubeus]QEM20418.1 carboxypeptidase-like regulatory domain-containing protein [Mucilaginibacter gossypii]QTE42859.1 carboxypeptidase-like regulatory domain-containing protein [Mucilaginibacter rubeus]QTE49460.1 carboxypeptidase-like regulatory domain-containing protein [Mucilaginibacter rubeus]QTE54556.1 carboxypept